MKYSKNYVWKIGYLVHLRAQKEFKKFKSIVEEVTKELSGK